MSKDGRINETPFLRVLNLKVNSRIMLTYNISIQNGLVNGETGIITGFILDKKENVSHIVIKFDNPNVSLPDQLLRLQKQHKLSQNHIPVSKISFKYSLGKANKKHSATVTIIQFPLNLAWATTIHKYQGQTVSPPSKLVVDLESVFAPGQAYVALGRVQSLKQLYISQYSDKSFKVSAKSLEETHRLRKIIDDSDKLKENDEAHRGSVFCALMYVHWKNTLRTFKLITVSSILMYYVLQKLGYKDNDS